MKISELVAELEVLWAEHGDVEALADYACFGDEVAPYFNEHRGWVVL